MASVTKPKGKKHYRVEYRIDDIKHSFFLPTGDKEAASSIARMVDRIIAQRKTNEPDRLLSNWLSTIPDDLRQRLEKAGLLEVQTRMTIGQAVNGYIDSKKASWKPKTHNRRLNENKWFIGYFGADNRLESVDRSKAVQFLNWLKDVKKLSPTHINSIMKWGTYIYKYATLCGVYTLPNPFDGVRVHNTVQRKKCYITSEYTQRLIDACPSVQWRTVVSMLRYGGMRPEEVLLAEWDGVDWEAGTFTFRSPKTEHHPGKERRTIPLFPMLRAAFEEMRIAAEMESGLVLPQYIISTTKPGNGWDSKRQSIADGKNGSLCELTDFIKIANLDNPGSVPTNMRGSCSTDLKKKYPEYAVDSWLGHTKEIARRHYDVVTPELFEQAAKEDAYGVDNGVDIRSQNRQTRHGAALSDIEQEKPQVLKNSEIPRDKKSPREISQGLKVPPAGVQGNSADPVKTRTERDLTYSGVDKEVDIGLIIELFDSLGAEEQAQVLKALLERAAAIISR